MASFNALQLFLDQTTKNIKKNKQDAKKNVAEKENNNPDDEIGNQEENGNENPETKPQKSIVNKPRKEEPKEKKIINLREWTTTDIELTKEELETLGNMCLQKIGKGKASSSTRERASKLIQITPCPQNGDHWYSITPRSVIGVIELKTKVLVIQPKIAVSNILFLLCYTWEPMEWRTNLNMFKESSGERMEALSHAIAKSFVRKVNRVLKRGTLQGYKTVEDTLPGVRGNILWSKQITKQYGRFPPLEVSYDEFTEDVEENRMIKAAVFVLNKTKNLDQETKRNLRIIDSKLSDVELVNYDPKHLPHIVYTPLNEYYKPAIDLARFVLRNLIWTLQHGSFDAPVFLLYMPKIFEDFIVNALRETKALQSLNANKKTFPQNKPLHFDTKKTIEIKPDFSFWDHSHCLFVGDCKYKRLVKRKYGQELQSFESDVNSLTPDLYQLLSYTIATSLKMGYLIYAEDSNPGGALEEPLIYNDLQPMNTDTVLKRRAINLNAEPVQILEQLEFIGKEIAEAVKQVREQKGLLSDNNNEITNLLNDSTELNNSTDSQNLNTSQQLHEEEEEDEMQKQYRQKYGRPFRNSSETDFETLRKTHFDKFHNAPTAKRRKTGFELMNSGSWDYDGYNIDSQNMNSQDFS